MDAKQYEDLKREYIRRKMAHADKMEKGNDEETSNSLFGGDSTRQTEANDEAKAVKSVDAKRRPSGMPTWGST